MNVWFHDQPPLLAKYCSNVFASGDVPANTSVRSSFSSGYGLSRADSHAGATYVAASRFAYFIPYEDGLMAGEDIYRPQSSIRYIKVEPHEMVDRDELRRSFDREASRT
jgi:hypothetical protein